MSELTWTCMICGDERPDHLINVLTRRVDLPGLDVRENIRYCADRPDCAAGALDFSLFKK